MVEYLHLEANIEKPEKAPRLCENCKESMRLT